MTTPGETGSVSQEQAAADAAQRQAIMGLAQALQTPDKVVPEFIKGIVTAVALPYISVQLGGDTSASIGNVRFIDSYSPNVGDTVQLMKQGSDILAYGQINTLTTAQSQNGWVAPTLASGWTTDSSDPVLYRRVVDNGDYKIQLRGRAYASGTPTLIWTMPSDMRPLFQKAPILVARGFGGGSVAAQLDVLANGSINLVGATAGITTVTVNAGGNDTNSTQQPNVAASGNVGGGFTDTAAGTNHNHICALHSHGIFAHSHTINDHTHTTTPVAVTYPDFVSFNGVEYFL